MKHTASEKKRSNGNGTSTRRAPARKSAQYALCIDNEDCDVSLERLKVYRLLRDARARKDGFLRVIDESGEDYLYAENRFIVLDLPVKQSRSLGNAFAESV